MLCAISTALCLFVSGTFASVPDQINFQGTLTGSTGNPVDGQVSFALTFYINQTSTHPLWTETHPSVEVDDGLYQMMMGSITPFPHDLFNTAQLWLEIIVDGETLSPRLQISSVAFGFRSAYADTADFALAGTGLSLPYSGSVNSSTDAFSVTNTGSGDAADFQSTGGIGVSASGSGYGVYATADEGIGVYGRSDFALAPGVSGYNSASGIGVSGSSSSNTGYLGTSEHGVFGTATDSAGFGVYGTNTATGNYGYLGGDSVGVSGYSENGLAGYFNGSVKVGSEGTPFFEIMEITGTTGHTGIETQISYPTGYNYANTRIISTQIESGPNHWITTGFLLYSTCNVSCVVSSTCMWLYHGPYVDKPYRIILMRIGS
jgi:hypothetical protein